MHCCMHLQPRRGLQLTCHVYTNSKQHHCIIHPRRLIDLHTSSPCIQTAVLTPLVSTLGDPSHRVTQTVLEATQTGLGAYLEVNDALVVREAPRGHEGEEVVSQGVGAAAHHLEKGLGPPQLSGDPAGEACRAPLPLLTLALACKSYHQLAL